MKEIENKLIRQTLLETELENCKGGFIIPFLISRAVYKTVQVIEKTIDWLTTDHKE